MTILIDEFRKAVSEFRTGGYTVMIFFTLHAGAYRPAVDRNGFTAQLTAAATSYKLRKPISIRLRELKIVQVTGL